MVSVGKTHNQEQQDREILATILPRDRLLRLIH